MITLQESIADFIFLSREIPLPLSALKIIYKNSSFSEVANLSEENLKSLLFSLKEQYKIQIRKIDEKVFNFTKKKNQKTFKEIERILRLCDKNRIKCLSYFDKDFPPILKRIGLPPKLIFIKGKIKSADKKAVAIIGTRDPTPYGKKMAIDIAKRFAELGFTIVSGFAKGIDTIAMMSAIDNGGRTIGVIGSGILNIYPKENIHLVNKVVNNGAIISEKFPENSVDKRALQIRNRITSGLGLGNIVVEGNRFSGTKWQLRYGERQGRPAIAVEPIDPECEQAFVPNLIINEKKGAKISDIKDVDYIAEILLNELNERKKTEMHSKKLLRQTNLFKF